ncbi:helix-turn-helix domain-containing protein [Aneurinibacillus migulanus]|uniref:Cupin domain-containing protein n=1 Tax=Aneurinibacillus migulanus TaxID=47500 RepID=A0A0D1XIT9_ANEMI|nr:XRE family transcriptional regulator [Aneurinibacillus migulanus]KIV52118.1 DNA-binding protein [Aneurinibacillus migulanus]KON98259.1 DNA-binding protein [Aneurinibacillus migulanus]MED0891571.1 XRE family transcriptional regulator [Aneurinibacillus migulanus]MED1613740.1 XRE family transcriptional regulator [Aneurinibacillus migulanus]MED4728982.1 XRE family transcriptional regulator [Aneurinibacillus migulanus]
MEKIHIKVGRNLQRIRKSRGLSLDKVAELTGVSKAMLGQIERGESNPTVTTLWKIATGLHLSFSSLIEDDSPSVSVISLTDVTPVMEDNEKYQVYPLFPFNQETRFEMYTVIMQPGCVHHSEAHGTDAQEYIIVAEGTLTLTIGSTEYIVREKDAIRFTTGMAHTYTNATEGALRLQMVIYYPA